jgi:hypothetical protein
MNKFFIKDCPPNNSIFDWISSDSRYQEAVNDIDHQTKFNDLIDIPHSLDINDLISTTKQTLNSFGIKGWQTSKGESKSYGGLSLVYNPDLVDSVDPNQNTLGTRKNNPKQFYYNSTEEFSSVRNTYFDSYGFRKLSPCVSNGPLHSFISRFNCSLTRSRIAVLDAEYHDKTGEDFLWHRDETVFENVRINIPIETDESFMFQIENKNSVHLEVGKIYTWNTNIAHRVYPTKKLEAKRIHIVLGFSPWLDYSAEEDAFVPNRFFGKVHPIEIITKGLMHPNIGHS